MSIMKSLRTLVSRLNRPSNSIRRRKTGFPSHTECLEDRVLLSAVPAIVSFGLQNDTGTPGDNITSDATVTGVATSENPTGGLMIELDYDGDGSAEQVTMSGGAGGFTHDVGNDLTYGQLTVQVRAAEWDFNLNNYVYSSWQSISFVYEAPPNNPAAVVGLQVDTSGVLTGSVTNDGLVSGVMIELDYDGDGSAEQFTITDGAGDFSHDVGLDLGYGQHTVQVRAAEWDQNIGDYIYGDWQSISFVYQSPNVAPVITEFTRYLDSENNWVFEGRVVDESPGILSITFGGSLAGETVVVLGDGTFWFQSTLTAGTAGVISAQATDSGGLQSNVMEEFII